LRWRLVIGFLQSENHEDCAAQLPVEAMVVSRTNLPPPEVVLNQTELLLHEVLGQRFACTYANPASAKPIRSTLKAWPAGGAQT
jgi:hypothetical protein